MFAQALATGSEIAITLAFVYRHTTRWTCDFGVHCDIYLPFAGQKRKND